MAGLGVECRFSLLESQATLNFVSGMLGPRLSSSPGLSENLHHGGHEMRYHAIEDASSVAQRLDASLVPPDRTRFEVVVRESLGNWIFHVPATVAVLWLSTVIVDLALMTSLLLGALVMISFVPSAVSVVLAVPRAVLRPFTRRGRNGYFWFLATTVMQILDCGVYGVCIFLLARAGGFAHILPIQLLLPH